MLFALVEPTDRDSSDSDKCTYSYRKKLTGSQLKHGVLLGNFNDQVGRNRGKWYPNLGEFGAGKKNSNGYRPLKLCRCNNLVIFNVVLGHKMAHNLI